MIWREKRVILIILGVLLLANTIFFFTYRVQYQSRLDTLDDHLEETERGLEQARDARVRAEQTFQGYRQVERDVMTVFNDQWSTEPARLTALIAEVKRLAVASSLTPASYAFQRGETQRVTTGRSRNENLGANEVGIAFGVQGTYAQLRRLINLLELSRQFVIIDQLGLTTADGQNLTMNLHLKTLFRDQTPASDSRTNRL